MMKPERRVALRLDEGVGHRCLGRHCQTGALAIIHDT